jgi:hypothetical protein
MEIGEVGFAWHGPAEQNDKSLAIAFIETGG